MWQSKSGGGKQRPDLIRSHLELNLQKACFANFVSLDKKHLNLSSFSCIATIATVSDHLPKPIFPGSMADSMKLE